MLHCGIPDTLEKFWTEKWRKFTWKLNVKTFYNYPDMRHLRVLTLEGLLDFDTGTGREHKLGELLMYKDHFKLSHPVVY